jgi:hypothetical protein
LLEQLAAGLPAKVGLDRDARPVIGKEGAGSPPCRRPKEGDAHVVGAGDVHQGLASLAPRQGP